MNKAREMFNVLGAMTPMQKVGETRGKNMNSIPKGDQTGRGSSLI